MKRAMYVVPAALAIIAAGVATVAQAAPAPTHQPYTTHRTSSPATAHRGSVAHPKAVGHRATAPRSKATADRGPADRAITRAIQGSPLLGDVPASDLSVRAIRIAPANSNWASAAAHPKDQRTEDATVALHLVKGRWTVITLGTAGVGCVVPTALRSSLHLTCEPGY